MKPFRISNGILVILLLSYVYLESSSIISMGNVWQGQAKIPNDSPEAYFKLGEEFLRKNDPQSLEKALAAFKEAIRLKPDYAEAYLGLGRAYHQRHMNASRQYDHPKEEVEAYLKALEFKSDLAEAYVSLGDTIPLDDRLESFKDSIKEATSLYNKALHVDPHCASAYSRLCSVYLLQKRFPEAEDAIKQALLLDPENRGYWRILHDSCWIGRRCEEVIQKCEELVQFKPENIIGLQVTARIYFKLGRLENSIKTYQRIIELAPDNVEVHYELGSVYIAAGDKQAALDEYNRLMSIRSSSDTMRYAKKLLIKIDSGQISLLDFE